MASEQEWSPLKLGPKPKRLRTSHDYGKCIICQQENTEILKPMTESGWSNLVEAAEIRQDVVHARAREYGNIINNVKYHRNCLYTYISKHNLLHVKQTDDKDGRQECFPQGKQILFFSS